MHDGSKVLHVLETWQNGLSVRLIADALDWRSATSKTLDTRRVHRALIALAVDGLVVQVDKRWRVNRKTVDKSGG